MIKDFFNKLTGKYGSTNIQPGGISRLTAAYLDCRCEYIPTGSESGEIAEMFDAAIAEGKEQGYYPVLIVTNEGNLAHSFYDNARLNQALEENVNYEDGVITVKEDFALNEEHLQALRDYRAKLLAEWNENDAAHFIQQRIEESTEYDDEFDLEEEWGGEDEGITFEDIHQGIWAPFDYDTKKSYELLLAKIPVSEPWQIAAWLPMGNWNECPAPKDLLAMAKRWYDRYGAVICCMSSDELEFRVSNPPTDFSEAYELAKEQYYFCQDRIEQYAGGYNLQTLANGLTKSPYWYFWWD